MFIDTHCHLNYSPLYENLDSVIENAAKSNVQKIICVGTDIESSRRAIDITEKYPNVFATAGIHPHDSESVKKGWQQELEELTRHERVVALGEIGLDFFRDYAPRDIQLGLFNEQIEIAKSLTLPMIIHNRRADDDVEEILQKVQYFNGVMQCFSSNAEFALKMIDLGLHISFTGNATYGSRKTEKAISAVPLDRLMLETDAPYLPPASKRGQTNKPEYIPLIANKIAELKECSLNTVENQTSENAVKFFRFPI